MLGWLFDKAKSMYEKEEYLQYEVREQTAIRSVLPQMNALCHAEIERFQNSDALDNIYNIIFNERSSVKKFMVLLDRINIVNCDGSSYSIEFIKLGISSLSNKKIIFDDPIMHINWNMQGRTLVDAISSYPYLDFCQFYSDSYPYFDECRAVGYVLAEKTGIPYEMPDHSILSDSNHYFIFKTQSLKSW